MQQFIHKVHGLYINERDFASLDSDDAKIKGAEPFKGFVNDYIRYKYEPLDE